MTRADYMILLSQNLRLLLKEYYDWVLYYF